MKQESVSLIHKAPFRKAFEKQGYISRTLSKQRISGLYFIAGAMMNRGMTPSICYFRMSTLLTKLMKKIIEENNLYYRLRMR